MTGVARLRRARFGAVVLLAAAAGVAIVPRSAGHPHASSTPGPRTALATAAGRADTGLRASVLRTLRVPSRALGRAATVTVYLPPGYSADGRYPLLVLLHGIPGSAANLANQTRAIADGLIRAGRIRPLLIAFPSGSDTPGDDATEWADGPGAAWFTFGTSEAPAAVAARFPVLPGAAARGIGGLSAGADAATNAMLAHPERWALLLAWSGSYEQTPATVGNDPALVRRFSALLNVSAAAPRVAALGRRVSVRVGRSDPFLANARRFVSALDAAGVDVDYAESAGGHDWTTWTDAIRRDLEFADGRLAH